LDFDPLRKGDLLGYVNGFRMVTLNEPLGSYEKFDKKPNIVLLKIYPLGPYRTPLLGPNAVIF
jgi:hypothetical protein